MKQRLSLSGIAACALVLACALTAAAANYPLQILLPRAGGTAPDTGAPTLSPDHFTLWAYPGVNYRVRAAVIGGAYPFTFALSGQPAGMSVDARGVITWINPQASDSAITLTVTDAEGTTLATTWGVTVHADKFRFLDCDAAATGSGTISDPWRNIVDVPRSLGGPHVGRILYFRDCSAPGRYNVLPIRNTAYSVDALRHDFGPLQWLAYPGERPVFDIGYTSSDPGGYVRFNGSPVAFVGFESINGFDRHVEFFNNHYSVFWDNIFRINGGVDGSNASFLMSATMPAGQEGRYTVIQDNDFSQWGEFNGGNAGCCVRIYAQTKLLIEGNSCHDAVGPPNEFEGIALKGGFIDRATVRSNRVWNVPQHGIGGNNHTLSNSEFHFNLVYNASLEAMHVNQDSVITTPIQIHRNTFIGRVQVDGVQTGAGPFRFYDNVIISNDAVGQCKPGSRISCWPVTDPSVISMVNNLEGTPSQGITDATGSLSAAYQQYLGTRGHQLGSGGTTAVAPSRPRSLRLQ